MKNNTNLFKFISEFIVTLCSSGLDRNSRAGLSANKLLYIQVLNAFSLIAVVFIVSLYLIYSFYRPQYISFLDSVFSALFFLIFFILIIYLRITKNDVVGRSVIVLSLYILFYAAVLFLDEEGAIYIFIALIPFFIIYLKGARAGLRWLILFFGIYLVIFLLSRFHVIVTKFPESSLDNIILGFILLSFFAYFSMLRIEQNTATIKTQLDEITRISSIDSLTRIMNKKAFMENLERERMRLLRRNWWLENRTLSAKDDVRIGRQEYHQNVNIIKERFGTLSVIIIDIDFFKIFNDSYGHLFGDFILKSIGEVFLSKEFLRGNDVSGRFGGEEFMILLPETSSEKALMVAERLRQKIVNMRFTYQEHSDISITLSMGIAEMRFTDIDSNGIIKRADIALYRAKESGRNRCVIYNDSMAKN